MNKIIEELLWQIYYQTDNKIGPRADARFIILNDILKDIHSFTGKQLKTAVFELKRQKLIEKKNYEDSVLVSLSGKGMLRALSIAFRNLERKKEKWDGKWRIVAFDIPEECRKGRNALRYRFRSANFYELQKSLFVYPYDCQKEVSALVKLFKLEKYVRLILAEYIDNEDFLKARFKLVR